MNISSVVVQTLPKFLDEVVESLKNCDACDYHLHDKKGRVIITIEGEGVSDELKKMKVIETIPHVVSAEMQMAYSEDELDDNMKVLENADAVPKVLQKDNIDVNDIIYNGDLRKKDLENFAEHLNKVGEESKE